MKPLKSGLAFSNWLLRFAIVFFMLSMFFNTLGQLNYQDKNFYLAAGFIIFGITLFIGGFTSKPTITVVSGFMISGLAIYKIINLFSGSFNHDISSYMIILAISFYFACSGNQS